MRRLLLHWFTLVDLPSMDFDTRELDAYLVRAGLSGFEPPLRADKFGYGQSNPTYLLSCSNGMRWVLRKKPPGKLIKGAHAVEREFKVISALHEDGVVPVPVPYLLEEDPTVIGTPFYIMSYVKGRIFKDPSIPGVSPSHRAAIYDDAIATLADIHSRDWRHLLPKFGRHSDYYMRQLKTLSKVSRLQTAHAPPIQHFDEIVGLASAALPPDAASLVHGDFKIDNLVFHETEPIVVAVLVRLNFDPL